MKKDLTKENLIESLIKSLPGLFVLFDMDGKILWWNNRLEFYSGFTTEQIENMKVIDFFGDDNRKEVEEKIEAIHRTGLADLEIRIKSEGKTIPFLLTGTSVTLSGVEYIIATGVNISSKENEYLENSIREKNLLLEEVHHRIKNNLATAAGLLKMQGREIENDQIKAQFVKSESRIQTMALVHQMLYEQKDFSRLHFRQYIEKMIEHLVVLYHANRDSIETLIDEDLYLDVNTSIPCALIIHELVSNALKHTCWNQDDCKINVILKRENGQNSLVVWDNGTKTFDIKKTSGLGMKLVKGLTKQMGGTMDVSFEDGVTFSVKFKSEAWGS